MPLVLRPATYRSTAGEPPTKRRRVHDTEPGKEAFSPARGEDDRMNVDQPFDFGADYGDFREHNSTTSPEIRHTHPSASQRIWGTISTSTPGCAHPRSPVRRAVGPDPRQRLAVISTSTCGPPKTSFLARSAAGSSLGTTLDQAPQWEERRLAWMEVTCLVAYALRAGGAALSVETAS